MVFAIVYIAIEFVNQLSRLSNFFNRGSPGALGSDLIGFVTILVPLSLLYGIAMRRKWVRAVALGWFGIELLFNLTVVFSAAIVLGRIVGVNYFVLFQIAGEGFVLLYMIRAQPLFADHFEAGVEAA